MQIHTSDNPAKDTGTYITEVINQHDGDIVCLLSGGSAIDVIEFIKPDRSECRTIFIMGDERVSREVGINNFLQIKERYQGHPVLGATIDTAPKENETEKEFATRINKFFVEEIPKLNNLKIISLQGIGEDGHTAGIFPMDEVSFQETYKEDVPYVPVHLEGLKIDSRASLTPTWLINHADEIYLYAVGKNKQVIVESLLKEEKEMHERPSELIKRHKNAHLFTDLLISY